MSSKRILFTIIASVLVAACGGGSGGGAAGPVAGAQTGIVTLTMSDAAVDGYSQINMVIREIRFLSDGGQDILVLDEPKTVDFLALSNFSEVLIKRDVVAGTYSKIRLILDSLTLVKEGTNELVPVDLHGLQKIDINPQGTFQVRGGQHIVIDVDVDLDRSIHIVTTGNGNGNGNTKVNFRPVIFATISTVGAYDQLFRVEGTIDSINGAAGTLNVCDIRRASGDGSRAPNPQDVCVFTDPDGDTSYFNSESLPLGLVGTGFGDLTVNDPVVMYGKFVFGATTDTFVPAVIAQGSSDNFVRERGISSDFVPAVADPDAPGEMNLDQTNDICLLTPDERRVSVAKQTAIFQEDAPGVEQRVWSRSDIERCRATEVEGSVIPDGADNFLRAFIALQGDPVIAEEELFGTLDAVAPPSNGQRGTYSLTLVPVPAAPADPERCVVIDADTKMVQIETSATGSKTTVIDTVPTGATKPVTVIGVPRDSDGCLVASDLIREIKL